MALCFISAASGDEEMQQRSQMSLMVLYLHSAALLVITAPGHGFSLSLYRLGNGAYHSMSSSLVRPRVPLAADTAKEHAEMSTFTVKIG